MRVFLFVVLCFLISKVFADSESISPALDDNYLTVNFDEKQPITFVGKKSPNGANGVGGGMMYPADTAGLFFVSILTHAAISGSVEKSRLSKEQELANKVLDPYISHTAKVNPDFLLSLDQPNIAQYMGLNIQKGDGKQDASRWHLKTVPVFAMTQSQNSIILYNKIVFSDQALINQKPKRKRNGKKSKKDIVNPNEKLVVIISDPVLAESASDFWLNKDAEIFYSSVKELYQDSLKLGIAKQFGGLSYSAEKQVTIRYLEDGFKKIERGYIIDQTCQRTIFESLSKEIKSVPNLDFASCKEG